MKRKVRASFLTLVILSVIGIAANAQPTRITDIPANSTTFVTVGDYVYFVSEHDLWRTDGTSAGTMLLKEGSDFPRHFLEFKGMMIFTWGLDELWRSDGTPGGTVQLSSKSRISILGQTQQYFFFAGDDAATGQEVYRTDGTPAGTMLVKDVNPGSAAGYWHQAGATDSHLFFAGNDGEHGVELWITDGSSAGTMMVKDINPGSADGFGDNAFSLTHNNRFYFGGLTSQSGAEPWVSDGTPAGTMQLGDLNPGPEWTNMINYVIGHDDIVYFLRMVQPSGLAGTAELWKTNGTPAGTAKVKALGEPPPSDDYYGFRIYHDKVYFFMRPQNFDDHLWVTDGTESGTFEIFHVQSGDDRLTFFDEVNDLLLFTGINQAFPTGFFRSDGTKGGTFEFHELKAGGITRGPRDFTKVGDLVFYGDHDGPMDLGSGDSFNEDDYFHLFQADGTTSKSMRTLWGVNTIGTQQIAGLKGKVIFATQDDQVTSTDTKKYLWIYDPAVEPEPTPSFTLVDAHNDEDMKRLIDGAMIRNPGHTPLNIRFEPTGSAGSVVFELNGVKARTETAPPYSLAGDVNGDYAPWQQANPGTYNLTATVYSGAGGTGTPGESLTINFTISDKYKWEEVPQDECTASGTILREYWDNVSGNSVAEIPTGTPPTSTSQLTIFEGPTNVDTNYGARIRGYICPPTTGDYTFWIASNDHSELWLSTDDNPANKRRIAYVVGATNPRQWDKFTTQQSSPVSLTAGQRYYIEALHKQGAGTDHVAVGWQLPDGTMERPISGSHLSPFELGENDLPIVDITSPQDGQTYQAPATVVIEVDATDADGSISKVEFFQQKDGATELTKLGEDTSSPYAFKWSNVPAGNYKITGKATDNSGTASSASADIIVTGSSCTASGTILREIWTGIQYNDVASIPTDTEPDGVSEISIFEDPSNIGDNYGTRVSGYICPPATGDYIFWISSNDHSELWLSTDDNPANIRRIAYVTGYTNPRQWTKFNSQQSSPVNLVAGQRYYIEALHKEGVGTDHMAVGWQLPDGTQERPIPGSRLSPFESESMMMNTFAEGGAIQADSDGLASELEIFPNPAETSTQALIVTAARGWDQGHRSSVEIQRMTGEIMYSMEFGCEGNCGDYSVPITGSLTPGIYIVNIVSNGQRTTRRLVVK